MAGITLTIDVDDKGTVKVKQFADEAKKAMKEMTDGPKQAQGPLQSLQDTWVGLTAKIAAATAVVYGVSKAFSSFINEAAEAEEIEHRLGYAVETAGHSYGYFKTQIDQWADSLMKATRFSDEEARKALTDMFLYTTNLTKAQQGASLAMDMATRKGMDLSSAARFVGMAMTGNIEILGRMLPEFRNLNDTLGQNVSMDEKAAFAMKILNEKFGGTAQQDVETYSGKVKQFSNSWREFKESIGEDALPALSSVFDWLKKIVDKMREQRELYKEQGGGFFSGFGKAPPGSLYMGVPSKGVFGIEEGLPEPGKEEILDPYVKKYGLIETELQDRLSRSKLSYQGWLEERVREGQTAVALLQGDLDKLAATWKGTEFEFPTEDILPDLMQIANEEGEILTLTKNQYQIRKYMNLEAAELLATTRLLKEATGAEFTYPTEDILSEWTTHPKTGKPVLAEQWKNEVNQMQIIFQAFGSNIQSAWTQNVTGIIKGTTTIADAFKNMATGMGDAFISAIGKMIANWLIFGNVTGVGFGANLSKTASGGTGWLGVLGTVGKWIGLQEGGIINRPTPAIVGESGPEAVIPLKGGKIPIEGGRGDTYVNNTFIQATDVDSFARRYGGVIESIYLKGKRFNKMSMRQ